MHAFLIYQIIKQAQNNGINIIDFDGGNNDKMAFFYQGFVANLIIMWINNKAIPFLVYLKILIYLDEITIIIDILI